MGAEDDGERSGPEVLGESSHDPLPVRLRTTEVIELLETSARERHVNDHRIRERS